MPEAKGVDNHALPLSVNGFFCRTFVIELSRISVVVAASFLAYTVLAALYDTWCETTGKLATVD